MYDEKNRIEFLHYNIIVYVVELPVAVMSSRKTVNPFGADCVFAGNSSVLTNIVMCVYFLIYLYRLAMPRLVTLFGFNFKPKSKIFSQKLSLNRVKKKKKKG